MKWRLKSSSFLNWAQNLPSLLFLPNCLFVKLQLFVSAYMNALWLHSKNCCEYITHTYPCIGSPQRNKSTYISSIYCHLPVFPGAHLDERGLLRSSIHKHYPIDIANPHSMQDAYHMNFLRDFAHHGVSVTQW